jgi:hypothetical protein
MNVVLSNLIGAWILEAFEIESPEGASRPWGRDSNGLLIYDAAGYMSVSINKAIEADPEQTESENLFDSILFYSGTYAVDGGIVRHRVTNASNPSRIGKDLIRHATLDVWLGLRPKEVDNLVNADLWRIETTPMGRSVLWVFQTKIVALPLEDRWKPIPILFEEQRVALRILQSGNFKRPLVRTVHHYFGPHIDLYGGRKGFTDLMLSRGQILENISVWGSSQG